MEYYDDKWTNVDEEKRKSLRYHSGLHRRRWHEYKKIGETEMESIRHEFDITGANWRVAAADHLQSRFLLARDKHGKPVSIAKFCAEIVDRHTAHKPSVV